MKTMNIFLGYTLRRRWQISVPLLFLSALIYTIGVNVFLSYSHAFQSGMAAFAQVLIFTLPSYFQQSWFSIFLILFNIPLFIIFGRYIKPKFLIYTAIWLLAQLFWSQILNLIPAFNDAFTGKVNPFSAIKEPNTQYFDVPTRFLYGLIGGTITAIAVGIAFFAGGSTAGTDIIIYYLSIKHKRSIGAFQIITGLITVFISIIIQFATGHAPEKTVFGLFFGITIFISITYVFIGGMIINKIYPSYKKVKVEVYSSKSTELAKHLKNINYIHSYTMRDEHSGFSRKEITVITSIMYYVELSWFLKEVKKIDKDVWISISYVEQVVGKFTEML